MFRYNIIKIPKNFITWGLVLVVFALSLVIIPMTAKSVAVFHTTSAPKCTTNQQRIQWINQLGWEVDENPTISTVIIPKDFDELYTQYAIMLREANFRLDKHRGKTVEKYTYTVTNYNDSSETAVITILQRNHTIIAADISSANFGGFLRPLISRDKYMEKYSK